MAYEDLRATLEGFSPLTEKTWAAIKSLISERNVARGDHLLRAGGVARDAFFVRTGLLREYYVDLIGDEATRRFCLAGDFSGSLADLLIRGPAAVSIEALEQTQLLRLSWDKLNTLSEDRADLMRLLRKVAEALYLRKAVREFEMLTLTASQRYHRFRQDYPALEARLPRHMIASYLGITPVHLGRITAGTSPRSRLAPRKSTRTARSAKSA